MAQNSGAGAPTTLPTSPVGALWKAHKSAEAKKKKSFDFEPWKVKFDDFVADPQLEPNCVDVHSPKSAVKCTCLRDLDLSDEEERGAVTSHLIKCSMTPEDADLPRSERTFACVADCAQNMGMPNFAQEHPGEAFHCALLNARTFGVVDCSDKPTALSAHTHFECDGEKGGDNVASLFFGRSLSKRASEMVNL